jgi:mRNA interferase MazF
LVDRGEVWLTALDPTVGSEIQKTRPCLVVSPKELNTRLRTVILAPLTTGSVPASFRVAVNFQNKNGLVVLDQIRTVDKRRLIRRLGEINPNILAQVMRALRDMFEE